MTTLDIYGRPLLPRYGNIDTQKLPKSHVRTDPMDGNTFVLAEANDESVIVTDIFGGHQYTLSWDEWRTWKVVNYE